MTDAQLVMTAELLLVDQGVKPMHCSSGIITPRQALVMSELLNNKFAHLKAEVWDDCIAVWHIEVVQGLMLDDFMYYGNDVLDAVKACMKSSTMGQLLGNGVRNMNKAKVQVAFSIRGRDIPGAFNTTHDHAYKIAMSRKIAYDVIFRNRVSFNIHYLHEVDEIRSFSGSHPRWSNAQMVKREMKDSCCSVESI